MWDSQTFTVYDSAVPNDKDFFFFLRFKCLPSPANMILGCWANGAAAGVKCVGGKDTHQTGGRRLFCVSADGNHMGKKRKKKKKNLLSLSFSSRFLRVFC